MAKTIKSEDLAPYTVSPRAPTPTAADLAARSEDAIIQSALEILTRRCTAREHQPLTSPDLTRAFLRLRLSQLEHEVFGVLWLDAQGAVLRMEELFNGTVDGASVYPREVVKAALKINAVSVIFYHNHPSGIAEPSAADRHITQRLKQALGLIDVRVLDHLIVGAADVYSFAEHGLV